MTKEELIVKQALKIENLEQNLKVHEEKLNNIRSVMVCIGGPLNDNRLKYSPKQLKVFGTILNEVEG